jgi:hypothetical protein
MLRSRSRSSPVICKNASRCARLKLAGRSAALACPEKPCGQDSGFMMGIAKRGKRQIKKYYLTLPRMSKLCESAHEMSGLDAADPPFSVVVQRARISLGVSKRSVIDKAPSI